MIIRKTYCSGHIREKQQFENYHFLAFFTLFYLKQPISLNWNKFEKNAQTEETLIWQALSIYIFGKLNMKSEHFVSGSSIFKFNLPHPLNFTDN